MSTKNFMSYGDAETVLTGFANAIKNNEDTVAAIKDGTDLDSFGDVEVALLDKADTSDLAGKQDKYETITYAQWQALTPAQQAAKDYYISDYPSSVLTAGNIAYDNTSSGMTANKVQGAIDELKGGLNDVTTTVNNMHSNNVLSNVDLNSYNTTNSYRIGSIASITNAPTDCGGSGVLLVDAYYDNIIQRFYGSQDTKYRISFNNGVTWSSWI